MLRALLPACLLLPLLAAAQTAPPPKGYKLHRVRRLRPAPLPPGGLVPYEGYFEWGLSDTLGRVYVRPDFENELEATAGPFWLTEWRKMIRNDRRGHRWSDLHGDAEVWLNARGQYLVVEEDYAAYRQPDGSLVARKYRRRLTEPLYRFEVTPHYDDDTETVPSPYRYWRNWQNGWVYYLGSGLYAVRGPSARQHTRRTRNQHLHNDLGPPLAIFDSTSRRLTPYRYAQLGLLHDGRIGFRLPRQPSGCLASPAATSTGTAAKCSAIRRWPSRGVEPRGSIPQLSVRPHRHERRVRAATAAA